MKAEKEDPRQAGRFENKLKGFIANLEKKGYVPGTTRTRYEGIRSFFEQNKIPLKMVRTDGPSGESEGSETAEKQDIIKALEKAPPEKRKLILWLKDSGLRLGDVLRIRWEDIEDKGDGFWYVKIRTQKRKIFAHSFVGPDVSREFSEMGENGKLVFPDRRTGGIKNISSASESLSGYLGKNLSAHSLRKFFYCTLQSRRLGIKESWIKRFIGKKVKNEDDPYVEKRATKLLEAYKVAYPALSLYGYDSSRLGELESEIERLKVKNIELKARLNGHKPELQQLRDELNELRKMIKKLAKEA